MKGINNRVSATSYNTRFRGPDLDTTRVLVVSENAASASAIAAALRAAGYSVTATESATRVFSYLENGTVPMELLVLDGSERPRVATDILDGLRHANWALPIILVAGHDEELRAEARRLGVEAVLDTPVDPDRLRSVATKLVPVVLELGLDFAS